MDNQSFRWRLNGKPLVSDEQSLDTFLVSRGLTVTTGNGANERGNPRELLEMLLSGNAAFIMLADDMDYSAATEIELLAAQAQSQIAELLLKSFAAQLRDAEKLFNAVDVETDAESQ